ncbi:CoA transferase [Nocardia wallacei]|uniref:CoA transferase n=1 Tax=Nocardia wallacei TaxID=480035 RepID=UPI002459083F|nr:CoA transferase [Nocardia wallacei]
MTANPRPDTPADVVRGWLSALHDSRSATEHEARAGTGAVEWRTRVPAAADADSADCAALGWAASGAMDLTGFADGPPVLSPAPAYGLLREVARVFGDLTERVGRRVAADPGSILAERAGLRGLRRDGQRTAGGAGRLLRAGDGWCAVSLSRPDDVEAVPALVGEPCAEDAWTALEIAAARWTATELAERAQLLGVPAAALPATARRCVPWRTSRIADRAGGRGLGDRVVVDLSSLWAGPLCAQLLGRAGARVVKVESVHRPDAGRSTPRFFDRLHAGHEFRSLDFRTTSGRDELADLIDSADIVLEASRPRALEQLGLGPADRPHRPGRIWLSLTGYGRDHPMRVAFGDDAAVAGGLVGWHDGEPVFCADAIGDPLSGLCAALAVAGAVHAGGGLLIDLSMRACAAAFATAPVLPHGPHHLARHHGAWTVECEHLHRTQPVLPPPIPAPVSAPAVRAMSATATSLQAWRGNHSCATPFATEGQR